MANAIKKISVARGYDVTRYTLQCFGGAGGQHACLVADALGMTRVFVHPLAGVLSAYGMGLADQNVIREQAVELPLAAAIAAAGRRAARRAGRRPREAELQRQQVSAGSVHGAPPRACALRGQRLGAGGAVRRHARRSQAGLRGRLPPALRLPDAGQGRWWWRRCRSRPWSRATRRPSRATTCTPRARCRGARRCACIRAASGTTPRWWCARTCGPATCIAGPGDHCREERHHRRRARLGGRS